MTGRQGEQVIQSYFNEVKDRKAMPQADLALLSSASL